MTSRRNIRTRINAVQTIRHVPDKLESRSIQKANRDAFTTPNHHYIADLN